MLDYQSTVNAMAVRTIVFTPQEYMFILQTILGEDPRVAYASVFDTAKFKRNVPSEDEEEYLAGFKKDAEALLEQQQCVQLRQYLEEAYHSEIQNAATNLDEFNFTGQDIKRLLSSLLHNRTLSLDEASVKDTLSLIKSMFDNGYLDSDEAWSRHFITIPSKYNTLCPKCGREGYAVQGLDFRCGFCDCVAKWDEDSKRYYPSIGHL